MMCQRKSGKKLENICYKKSANGNLKSHFCLLASFLLSPSFGVLQIHHVDVRPQTRPSLHKLPYVCLYFPSTSAFLLLAFAFCRCIPIKWTFLRPMWRNWNLCFQVFWVMPFSQDRFCLRCHRLETYAQVLVLKVHNCLFPFFVLEFSSFFSSLAHKHT